MNDKPRRRFWQIHLSTAIVLMFCHAGLLTLEISFNSDIESGLMSVLKADAISASDVNPTPTIPLFPLYLLVNAIVSLALGVSCEYLARRRESRR